MRTSLQKIDLSAPDMSVLSGHLKMGGANPQGLAIGANSRYLTLGGQPWLPVMGEFHFSRYPADLWRDELLKMKAGGIAIVASYIFWIHHEVCEGQIDWSGSLDLRRFVTLCAECGLYFFVRVGPWVHGEARNGGFPDWLVDRCGDRVRLDAEPYLSLVSRWYSAIAHQLQGLLWKDGGPVIGVQIENELLDQPLHLASLKRMAIDAGLVTPLYTMTGWGPAQAPPGGDLIPLFGGYPDACWNRQTDTWARECRIQYFFNLLRDDNAISADVQKARPGGQIADLHHYPFGTAETGGGMQVSYHRRAYISTWDVAALALTKIGSGNNLQGYYMFHGGSQPFKPGLPIQESQATNYWNDYPFVSYDFQAPLGEFGQVRESYHALRLLHQFLADFGPRLAPLPAQLPQVSPHRLDDGESLRWAARSDGHAGFLFVNNYQRMEPLPAHESVQFDLQLKGERLILPSQPVRIPSGLCAIWPFNLDMDGVLLKWASVQPFCRLEAEEPCYVFFTCEGVPPELAFEDGLAALRFEDGAASIHKVSRQGRGVRIMVFDEQYIRQSWKVTIAGRQRLIFSPADLTVDGSLVRLRSRDPQALWLRAADLASGSSVGQNTGNQRNLFSPAPALDSKAVPNPGAVQIRPAAPPLPVRLGSQGVATPPPESAFAEAETWQVRLPVDALDGAEELYLIVDYQGDIARLYLGECLIADDFYSGKTWEVGMRRFLPQAFHTGLTLKVLPLHPKAPVYIQPAYQPVQSAVLVRQVRLEREFECAVPFSSLEELV